MIKKSLAVSIFACTLDDLGKKGSVNRLDEILRCSMAIQMQNSEQYFPVVLAVLLCCTRWFQLSSLWMKSYGVTIQMKATEQYFPMALFIMLY